MSHLSSVLLTSGGLDSTVLAYHMMDQGSALYPLFIDYGQHSADTELAAATSALPAGVVERIATIRVAGLWEHSDSRLLHAADLWRDSVVPEDLIVPNRNVVLLTLAAAYASSRGLGRVAAAFINSNHASEVDATSMFIRGMSALVAEVWPIELLMPFRDMSKEDVAQLGARLGTPLWKTYSCQINPRVHCGACPNCRDRLDALRAVS